MAGFTKWLIAILVTGLLASPLQAQVKAAPKPFSDEAVEQAIENGKKCLWALYNENEGHWPEMFQAEKYRKGDNGKDANWSGCSALAVYALLAAGESYQTPKMKKALEWQSKQNSPGTYALGLRCQIWAMLPREKGRDLLEKDVKLLMESVAQAKSPSEVTFKDGTWSYECTGTHGGGTDHSNTQYGYLGVWAGCRANLEAAQNKEFWIQAFRHYQLSQRPEGGWGYDLEAYDAGNGPSSATMTAGGLASMYVAFDQAYNDQFVKVGQNADVPNITRGLKWMDENLNLVNPPNAGYLMYGVERVGLASGRKYFGQKDWYKLGATKAINEQKPDGSWAMGYYGPTVETSYAMLFLVRGRNPVLFNRLEYGVESKCDWNNRPRAVANLTAWISRTFEREVSWQIIPTTVPVEEWHDAPILMITGSKRPEFTEEEIVKLRTYILQGGLIWSIAEGGPQGKGFDAGMRQVYKKLFPDYELVQMPVNHPLYGSYFKIAGKGGLWGLSNGVRLLALHGSEDLPLSWQKNQTSTVSEAFQTAANVFFFATDKASLLRARGTTLWPPAKAFEPASTLDIVRLRHKANWNAEPLAWERFKLVMGNDYQVQVNLSDKDVKDLAPADRLAVMTGTSQLNLNEEDKAAIKNFVKAGGTLVVDATGGSDNFAKSSEKLLEELFGADSLASLDAESPIYLPKDANLLIGAVKYRRAAETGSGKKTARLQGVSVDGRLAVVYSRDDLTTGLLGVPCFTCVGYVPKTAMALMRNIMLQAGKAGGAGGATSAPAATEPASAAAN
jgi:hypothetical protein